MYQFRALDKTGLQQIAACFNLAFSDYEQPMHFTPESLNYYLTASGVDLSLSFGAFCGEELVGFILNSSGIYKNQPVVFDAGTGIVPEHRGKKVFSGLFEYTCRQLQHCNIEKYYLEALQSNHHAVSIYSKVGFSVCREYSVLAATGPKHGWDERVAATTYQDFEAFSAKFSVDPSYEHTLHMINKHPQLYEVLYLENLAYCIYAKRNGQILQMHYNELDALKEVVSALISRYPSAWAKNVDCSYHDVIQMLTALGFVEITKQYEMARDI